MRLLLAGLLAIGMVLQVPGCGGTGTGNPYVDMRSPPYLTGVSLYERLINLVGVASAWAAAPVTEFKFCSTKLKLKNEAGEAVGGDATGAVEAVLGQVDISNGAVTQTWGRLEIPVGFTLSRIEFELHYDPEKCAGADYSIRYNGVSITRDLDFRFQFSPAIVLDAGDVLNLRVQNIQAKLAEAETAGQLNDTNVASYLATVEGEGSED